MKKQYLWRIVCFVAAAVCVGPDSVRCAAVPDSFVLGINFAGISDWGTEPVWKDLFKQSRTWCPQRDTSAWGKGWPLAVDSLGWVSSLDEGQTADSPLFGSTSDNWTSMDPDCTYICTWEGNGVIEFWNAHSYETAGPRRIELRSKAESAPFLNLVETDASDPIRNIRIFRRDHEGHLESRPWHESFLDRWKDFGVVRFMDWGSTNNSPVQTWSQRTRPHSQTQAASAGVALEYMIDYCNRTQTNPWFCIPHMADDNFVRKYAEMVRDSLDEDLVAYVEYSNEVWNNIFDQTDYCERIGLDQGLRDADRPWESGWAYSGRRSGEIFDIWEEVFGGTGRFIRVVASQMNTYVANIKLRQDEVFNKTDALAIAPYFGGNLNGERLNDVQTWSVEQILDSCEVYIEGRVREGIQDFVDYLNELNEREGTDIKLIAYEGGQHLSAWNNNQEATDLFTQANRHPRMKELYLKYFNQWIELGGKTFANFSSVSSPGGYGAWGVLESVEQDVESAPKYQALMELLERHSVAAHNPGPQRNRRVNQSISFSTQAGAVHLSASMPFDYSISTVNGRTIAHSSRAQKSHTLWANRLPAGVYVVSCRGHRVGGVYKMVMPAAVSGR